MKTALVWMFLLACLAGGVAAAADAPPPAPAKKIDWAKMNAADRKKHMQDVVLPEMKKLFSSVDAFKYGDMTCETCHGPKPSETSFKMPNPALVKLPPPMDRTGFMALHQKKSAMTNFMGNQVKPAMAALLGLDPWTPSNTTGFGCYACHVQAGDPEVGKEPALAKEPAFSAEGGGLKEAKLMESDGNGADTGSAKRKSPTAVAAKTGGSKAKAKAKAKTKTAKTTKTAKKKAASTRAKRSKA
jgi:hypothetical protein